MKIKEQKNKIIKKGANGLKNRIHNIQNRSKFIKSQRNGPSVIEVNMESTDTPKIPFLLDDSINSVSIRKNKIKMPKVSKKTKLIKLQNDILSNFVSDDYNSKSISSVTIGASIIPNDINYKRVMVKSPKVRRSHPINKTLDLDTDSINTVTNATLENLESEPSPHFYSCRNEVICIMKPKCKFSFHGKLKIKVLYGSVEIYGTVLNKLNTVIPIEIYSSNGNNLVSIQTTTMENICDNLLSIWSALKTNNIDCNIANALQTDIHNLKEGWAVIILRNFDNNLTKFLETYCNYKLFPKIENTSNYSWSDVKRAEIVLQSNIYCGNTAKQTINFSGIDRTIDKILIKCASNNNSKIILSGGKSVGKSTTMRYLVNRLLEKFHKVIVLDLDPGQSEFTPPGCISFNIVKNRLLGPNFTHLQKPYYQLYIGSTDVTRSLLNYINAVQKLVHHCNTYSDSVQLPIIINTMGFCRGVGWNIMTTIIKCVQPTDVIQIVSERPKNNFDKLLNTENVNTEQHTWAAWENFETNEILRIKEYELHIVNSQAEIKSGLGEMWNIEPHQQREIVMLAYLSEINKHKTNSISYDNTDEMNINSIVPYQVPFSAMKLSLGYSATPQVLSVMNGNIIALCGYDSDNEQKKSIDEHSTHYPEVLIRLPLSTCYGYGILRGVDMEGEKIYINTPLSLAELKHVNCLIGCMSVPPGLLQSNRLGAPYTGGDDYNLPTSRDPRRGYFRMNRH